MTKISVLHATRGRIGKYLDPRNCYNLWMQNAEHPERIEWIFGVDSDDVDTQRALIKEQYSKAIIALNEPQKACVGAYNACAEASSGDLLVFMADDLLTPPKNWDSELLQAVPDIAKPYVLWIDDELRKDELMTIAIMTKQRYTELGYFLHPDFKSMYSDNFHTWKSHKDGVVVDARHIKWKHSHYSKTGIHDDTYAKHCSQSRYVEGSKILSKLIKEEVYANK